MKKIAAVFFCIVAIAAALAAVATYTGYTDLMPESVRRAAASAADAAGKAVSSIKPGGSAEEEAPDKPSSESARTSPTRPPSGRTSDSSPAGSSPPARADEHRGQDETTDVQSNEPVPARASVPISLPRSLSDVEFGMRPAEIMQLYPIAQKNSGAAGMTLTHRRDAAGRYTVKFRFQQDALYEVEIEIAPAEGETAVELYETLRSHYHRRYGEVAKSQNRWSDGVVSAHIFRTQGRVHLQFGDYGIVRAGKKESAPPGA